MNSLSKHISKMNNLKNKIKKFSIAILREDHNILQKQEIKALTEEELFAFKKIGRIILSNASHFEITNISKNGIKLKFFFTEQETFPAVAPGETSFILGNETIKIKNIFKGIA